MEARLKHVRTSGTCKMTTKSLITQKYTITETFGLLTAGGPSLKIIQHNNARLTQVKIVAAPASEVPPYH